MPRMAGSTRGMVYIGLEVLRKGSMPCWIWYDLPVQYNNTFSILQFLPVLSLPVLPSSAHQHSSYKSVALVAIHESRISHDRSAS